MGVEILDLLPGDIKLKLSNRINTNYSSVIKIKIKQNLVI